MHGCVVSAALCASPHRTAAGSCSERECVHDKRMTPSHSGPVLRRVRCLKILRTEVPSLHGYGDPREQRDFIVKLMAGGARLAFLAGVGAVSSILQSPSGMETSGNLQRALCAAGSFRSVSRRLPSSHEKSRSSMANGQAPARDCNHLALSGTYLQKFLPRRSTKRKC